MWLKIGDQQVSLNHHEQALNWITISHPKQNHPYRSKLKINNFLKQ